MPFLSFNTEVLSSFGLPPLNLNFSTSGASNTVVLDTVGTVNGKQVMGAAFDALPAGQVTGVLATISAFNGTFLKVDTAYNGKTFALIFKDRSSSIFTVATGQTVSANQVLSGNAFETVYPEIARLKRFEYI